MELTKEVYEAIISIVDERVREIRVTREDFESLRAVVRELAEAQKVLTQRVDQLAQRMDQLTQRVDQLAQTVHEGFKDLRRQVGVVSERFGFTLEDLAADRLPRYLKTAEGWAVEVPVAREYRIDDQTIEVDLVAEARKGKRRAILMASVKSRIVMADVRSFHEQLARIPEIQGAALLPVMCGLLIAEDAKAEGRRLGVRMLYLRGLA